MLQTCALKMYAHVERLTSDRVPTHVDTGSEDPHQCEWTFKPFNSNIANITKLKKIDLDYRRLISLICNAETK